MLETQSGVFSPWRSFLLPVCPSSPFSVGRFPLHGELKHLDEEARHRCRWALSLINLWKEDPYSCGTIHPRNELRGLR